MVDGYIVLKYIGEPTNPTDLVVVHETAHALHYFLDSQGTEKESLSKEWFNRYKLARERGGTKPWRNFTDDDLVRTGTISAYANFDLEFDEPLPAQMSVKNRSSLTLDGLTMKYAKEDLKNFPEASTLLNTLLRDRANMPVRMAGALTTVIFDPQANLSHFQSSQPVDSLYHRVREDIAASTEYFTLAALFPFRNQDLLTRIAAEETLRSKIKVLLQNGFLKSEAAEFLLNPDPSKNAYSYGAGWQPGTVFPPFVGIVPYALSSEEIALTNYHMTTCETAGNNYSVGRIKFFGKTFYSSTELGFPSESRDAQRLRDFVLGRSDLGIASCFVGRHPFFDDEEVEAVWISDPRIKSVEDVLMIGRNLKQLYTKNAK